MNTVYINIFAHTFYFKGFRSINRTNIIEWAFPLFWEKEF